MTVQLCGEPRAKGLYWVNGLRGTWGVPPPVLTLLSPGEKLRPTPPPVVYFEQPRHLLEGMGVAIFSPWELDRTVQLRQELMLGIMEFEQAGYYVKEAFAALGGDRKLPHPGLVQLKELPGVWAFVHLETELEALRTAVCRRIWTEMNNVRAIEALGDLVDRYAQLAELEDEFVHVAAAYLAFDAPEAAKATLADVTETASDFTEPVKRAEMLADVLRGRIRYAIERDGN